MHHQLTSDFSSVIPERAPTVITGPTKPAFTQTASGWNAAVRLGRLPVLCFDPIFAKVDASGALRERIVTLLNSDPTLTADIIAATFYPPSNPI